MKRVQVIDSHTGGEPTRLVVGGLPDLGSGPLAERLDRFRDEHDGFRSAVVNEPRGSDVIVGAALVDPVDSTCSAGVLFFNNVGYLNMCGHGTIGLLVTLRHLGRIGMGEHRIETPVGIVTATLHDDHRVSVRNVRSYRSSQEVVVDVPGVGEVVGDIAWGGNWFFLTKVPRPEIRVNCQAELTSIAWAIRRAVNGLGKTVPHADEVDHIELFGPPLDSANDSRSFVLCPGGAYDRSPCGTGTSAKVACLHADGVLAPAQIWRQESVAGSVFEASVEWVGEDLIPTVTGTAFVTGESTLILDDADPFCWGIPQ
ncbi:MAG: 4-hydroxyproline epimerase [Limisphaerales bacterium]|jgi:4-hydroxyproline epimerase